MSNELKPCPFCGTIPKIGDTIHGDVYLSHKPSDRSCVLGNMIKNFSTKEKAVEAWNTRAQPVATASVMNNEELRAYIESLKVGEIVIETGKSCMTGEVGTIYISDSEMTRGAKCVMWELYKYDTKMGTSVTGGTRRIKDVLNAYNTLRTEKP